jgi:hypothetical protein
MIPLLLVTVGNGENPGPASQRLLSVATVSFRVSQLRALMCHSVAGAQAGRTWCG